ncbi:unnamed protein product, partial [Symbiodinium pilosum]
MQVCIRAGYDSEELFCGAFVDQAAFEGWMAKFQAKLPDAALTGLAADEWKTHPVAARLRIFWQSLQRSPVVGQQALATRSAETALALLTPNSGAKLSPSDRERWEWLPWRRALSEEQLLEVKARRSRTCSDSQPDEWDLDIAGAALRVQHLLETRAHAFAMIGACHLHSWTVYIKKFLHFYARRPAENFRSPSVSEAEMADRAVLEKVFQLCFSGYSLDDALSHVVVDRDMLRHVLVERPRLAKADKEKVATPPPPPTTLPPLPRRPGTQRRKSSLGAKGAASKRLRNGECRDWVEGRCVSKFCRFKHECAVCGDVKHHAGIERSERVVPGQPLALELWDGLLTVTQDVDAELPRLLEHGVSTGVVNTIPPSGVWREVEVAERPDLELLVHDAPWGSGRADPRLLMELVQADVDCGFAEWLPRGLAQDWTAFVLDVSKAHKRVKVRHSEQGLSLFTVIDESGRTHWLVYKTCHFGCAWAAFWWARVAAGLIRLTHVLIAIISHFLSIYVDDSLSLLPSSSAKVRWIGWLFNLGGKLCATLPEDKSVRLVAALSAVARVGSRHSRRELESLVGLLSWYTCGARWLKQWTAIWFRMLLKAVLRFLPLDRAQLAEVLELLNSRARLLQRAQLCDAQAGWKLLECGGQIVKNSWFQDCEFKNGRVWVKFGDFDASCVQATKEESSVALFFLRIVQANSPVHLVEKEGPCVVAAADAFAERDV